MISLRPPPPVLLSPPTSSSPYTASLLDLLVSLPRTKRTGIKLRCRTNIEGIVEHGVGEIMEYYVEWMRKEEKKDESDNIDDCDSDGEASASVGTWVKILSSLSSFGLHTTIASSTKRHLSTVISDAVQSLCDEYEDLDEDEIETPSPNSPYPLLEKLTSYCTRLLPLLPPVLSAPTLPSLLTHLNVKLSDHLLSPTTLWSILRGTGNGREVVLKKLIKTQALEDNFVSNSISVLKKRLLHNGVATSVVVEVYVNFVETVCAMSDKLLTREVGGGQSLQGIFGEFLRRRVDTVRVVVSSLLNEDEDGGLDLKGGKVGEEEEEDFEGVTSLNEKGKEVLDLLVGVFGSKDKFIAEYRSLLSTKLAGNRTFEVDGEIRKLELLKLRFGEGCLRECEIMIRDLEESRRIHNNYRSEGLRSSSSSDFTALVVSSVFWPQLSKTTFSLHPELEVHKTMYNASFKKLKKPRELVWYDTLGKVELDVEIHGVLKTFNVTPLQASVIMHFGNKGDWKIEDLANELSVNVATVRKRLGFWAGKGVVREVAGVWRAVEEGDESIRGVEGGQGGGEEEDEEKEGKNESHATYKAFVLGMLQNMGPQAIISIENMLRMFVQGEVKYDLSRDELAGLLKGMVKEETVEERGGVYSKA